MNRILNIQKGMRTWQLVSILTIASLLMSAFPAGFFVAEATTTDEATSTEESTNTEGPKTNLPLAPSFVTVVAHKIICTDETELPNYGKGGPDITGTTATDWVANHKSCSLAEGWNFQYTTEPATDPGDTMTGEAPSPWQTFGPTDSNGQTSVNITAETIANNTSIRLREVLKDGYIPFTHDEDNTNGNDVSAEFYCHTDVLNYDNDDYIKGGVEMGKTYQCVAWNSPKPQSCNLTLVSDAGTLVSETNDFAVPTYDEHPSWTANIPGATWVWVTDKVQNPTGTETNTFVDTFTVTSPSAATLTVAADNQFVLFVNGDQVDSQLDENNFSSENTYDITSKLVSGENEIKFVVTNMPLDGGTYQSNPAGVLYRLDLTGKADCARTTKKEEPKTTTVTMCKINQNESPLSGWQLSLLGDKVETLNVDSKSNDEDNSVSSSVLPAGSYVAKADGTFKYRGNTDLLADARFSERLPGDPTYGGIYLPWSAGITGWLYMNSDNTVWGNVFSSSTHAYYAPLSGGSSAEFYVGDSDYRDNVGSLKVDIYKGFTGITNENGCVAFRDVPYGDYSIEELLQPGWTNVSGLGPVTVNSESNVFTVMNSDGTRNEYPDPDTITLTGYKFNDLDGDGYFDEGENGIPGWTITATNGDNSTTTVTGEGGYYEIEVPEGNWTVSEVMQAGWEQTGVMMNGDPIEGSVCNFPIADYDKSSFKLESSEVYKGPEYECSFGNKEVPVIDGGNPDNGGNDNRTTTSGSKIKKKKPTPQVLGAATSTDPVLCPFLKDYMQMEIKNDSWEVTKLQMFLSIVMGLPTPVTGIFDATTDANVKLFQERYRSEILDPWFKRGIVPHDRPTGFVYKTTRWKINDIICPGYESYPSFDGENLQSNTVIR